MNKKTTKIISTIIVALILITMVLSMVIQFVQNVQLFRQGVE